MPSSFYIIVSQRFLLLVPHAMRAKGINVRLIFARETEFEPSVSPHVRHLQGWQFSQKATHNSEAEPSTVEVSHQKQTY